MLRIKPLKQEESDLLGEDWKRLYEKPFYRRFSLGAAFWGPFWFLYYRMPWLGLGVVLPLFVGATILMTMHRMDILEFLGIHFAESIYKPVWEKLTGELLLLLLSVLTIGYGAPVFLRHKIKVIVRQGKGDEYEVTSRKMLIYPLIALFVLLCGASLAAYLADPELFLENLRRQSL